jgi:hypothetical protein
MNRNMEYIDAFIQRRLLLGITYDRIHYRGRSWSLTSYRGGIKNKSNIQYTINSINTPDGPYLTKRPFALKSVCHILEAEGVNT